MLTAEQRRKSVWVIFTVFLRSALDFAGVAALVPVIFMLADKVGNDKKLTLLLCGAVVLFVVLKNGLILILAHRQINFQLGLFRDMSRRMFINYYRRGMMFLKKKSSVQLAYEVNGIAMTFSHYVLASLFSILGDGMLVIMMFLALVIWKPLMGLMICVLFIPLILVYAGVVKRKVRRLGTESLKAQRAQSRTVVEAFRGYAELEIANAFQTSLETYDRNMRIIERNRRSIDVYQMFPYFLSELAVVAGLIILVAFGGNNLMVTGGVFAVAAFRIIPAVRSGMNSWSIFQNNAFAIDVVRDGIKDDDLSAQESANTHELTFSNGLEAKNVAFAFPDGSKLFEHVDFKIDQGERIGIKGRSGAGKSTLFNLMLGFLKPTEGSITIDGINLDESTRKSWHSIVGYVPQEIFIIDGTLAENIALGHKEIDRPKVLKVLKQVQLDSWAEDLENGLDTNLGEYGSRLSGGQKQRIGIARALYKGARVLFFDEATSSLDSATEKEINLALKDLSENYHELTMVIIAHRESSLEFCNRIITLGECPSKTIT